MRIFEAKNLDEVLKLASEDLGIQIHDLIYDVIEEKKGLFKSSIKISVYETTDYIDYAVKYLKTVVLSYCLKAFYIILQPAFQLSHYCNSD